MFGFLWPPTGLKELLRRAVLKVTAKNNNSVVPAQSDLLSYGLSVMINDKPISFFIIVFICCFLTYNT